MSIMWPNTKPFHGRSLNAALTYWAAMSRSANLALFGRPLHGVLCIICGASSDVHYPCLPQSAQPGNSASSACLPLKATGLEWGQWPLRTPEETWRIPGNSPLYPHRDAPESRSLETLSTVISGSVITWGFFGALIGCSPVAVSREAVGINKPRRAGGVSIPPTRP